MRSRLAIVAVATVAAFAAADVRAQDKDAAAAPAGIQWFATWDQCHDEAKRTNRPILLVAAAPHCHEISGLW